MWELTLVLALVLVVVVWLGNKRYQALQKQNCTGQAAQDTFI